MKEQKKSPKKRALGRGLEAILPASQGEQTPKDKGITLIPITRLTRNPNQARQSFSTDSLNGLAQSMKKHGVLQPVIVRTQAGGRYEIVTGERRWRAAQIAGLLEIPAIIKQISEKQAAEINLIENIQREDLNPIEEAEADRRLLEEHGYTQEKLAERLGKSRTALTNLLRLLDLPLPVQEMIRAEKISEGHGRALLRIDNERLKVKIAMEITGKKLSVRETEKLAARMAKSPSPARSRKPKTSPEIGELCNRLQRRLGTKVNLKHSKLGSGRMEVFYRNLDELDRILAIIFKR